jgi:hypothetical protein
MIGCIDANQMPSRKSRSWILALAACAFAFDAITTLATGAFSQSTGFGLPRSAGNRAVDLIERA